MIATVTLNPSLDEWIQLPSLRLGQLNRAQWGGRYPGGKGINVSRVVWELGGHTMAYGLAGGNDGMILRELMNARAIPHEFVTIAGSTRNNYKIRIEHPKSFTEVNTAGPTVSATHTQALQRRILQRRPRPACVALSGSLPPGAPSTIYQRWIRVLRRVGIPTILDASGAALREGLRSRPWCIKPNRQEAEELLRSRLTQTKHCIHAVRQLLTYGPELVILSLGREGALMALAAAPGVWMAIPPAVKVESAVGAGDSLVGGFLVGWSRQQPLPEAFRLGAACGTAAAMTGGTELCRRADVERLVARVRIKRVA